MKEIIVTLLIFTMSFSCCLAQQKFNKPVNTKNKDSFFVHRELAHPDNHSARERSRVTFRFLDETLGKFRNVLLFSINDVIIGDTVQDSIQFSLAAKEYTFGVMDKFHERLVPWKIQIDLKYDYIIDIYMWRRPLE